MGFDSKGLDDYIDVAQRIAEFRVKHPEGSLQPLNPEQPFEIRELAGAGKDGKEVRGTFIIYIAAAYRTPDDPRPGVGCAYEVFPGRTPYTAGSELQNAETAAWGRAIVAALAADTRAGVASQQEVRNRQAERDATPATPRQNRSDGNGQQPQRRAERPAAAAPTGSSGNAWLAAARRIIPDIGLEACQKMRREAIEKGRSGEVPPDDVNKVLDLLKARMEALANPPKGAAASPVTAALKPDDPWATAFRDAVDAVEAERLLADLRGQAGRGEIDPGRAALVEQAAEELFPGITTMEAKDAA